jgi:hypothetical protein
MRVPHRPTGRAEPTRLLFERAAATACGRCPLHAGGPAIPRCALPCMLGCSSRWPLRTCRGRCCGAPSVSGGACARRACWLSSADRLAGNEPPKVGGTFYPLALTGGAVRSTCGVQHAIAWQNEMDAVLRSIVFARATPEACVCVLRSCAATCSCSRATVRRGAAALAPKTAGHAKRDTLSPAVQSFTQQGTKSQAC